MKPTKQVGVRAFDTTTGEWLAGSGASVSDALQKCAPQPARKSKAGRKRALPPRDGAGGPASAFVRRPRS